ncbi:MAG: hypothetical protein CL910_00575 [Deltaproteobacteria bacterium]|jgi:magnesium chelatase family protein|nr:hypothetical protein [Deltaproteobacteria bacterium]
MAGQARIMGATLLGIEGVPIEVEVRISSQLPRIDIVGLPEAAVRESAARVRAAIQAIGLPFPDQRVTVNLAPAALRKQGAGLDLAIAVGVLAAAGHLPAAGVEQVGLVGELALDGRVRGVRGALVLASCLAEARCARVIVPEGNAAEASLLGERAPEIVGALGPLVEALTTERRLGVASETRATVATTHHPNLADVRGQAAAKRALLIAAAGGHGLLLRGAPGAGKTLLARCLPGILPPLAPEEALEVARIHDSVGLAVARCEGLVRPFRAPHHSASQAGLLGGGRAVGPGEVTLAHRGVLFLDELVEFQRGTLESLRQVLEEGRVVLSRAEQRVTLPARFQLIAAANPCPCGWWQSGVRDCRCDDNALARYARRLSGPLLDRIDMHVHVRPVPFLDLDGPAMGDTSEEVRERVIGIRALQSDRLAALGIPPGGRGNAALPFENLTETTRTTRPALRVLARAVDRLALSARAAHRLLRVARTIADLEGEAEVTPGCVAEAVGLRPRQD